MEYFDRFFDLAPLRREASERGQTFSLGSRHELPFCLD